MVNGFAATRCFMSFAKSGHDISFGMKRSGQWAIGCTDLDGAARNFLVGISTGIELVSVSYEQQKSSGSCFAEIDSKVQLAGKPKAEQVIAGSLLSAGFSLDSRNSDWQATAVAGRIDTESFAYFIYYKLE